MKELWDAYDCNYNIIEGKSLVRGEDIDDGVYHIVVDVMVEHSDGTILIMQRDGHKETCPLKWDLSACGSIFKGEDPIKGARRELKEETGIDASELEYVGRMIHLNGHNIYYQYKCVVNVDKNSVILQDGETVDYRWVNKEELKNYDLSVKRTSPFYLDDAKFVTDRLYLREFREEDFIALFKVLGDKENMKYYDKIFDETLVHYWISKSIEKYKEWGHGLWAVCLRDSGEVIGDCGVTMQNIDGEILPEIGYHIRLDMHGKGYAKEAATYLKEWAFRNTKYDKLYSYMTSDNMASRKTAQSYGAHFLKEYKNEEGISHTVYMVERDK